QAAAVAEGLRPPVLLRQPGLRRGLLGTLGDPHRPRPGVPRHRLPLPDPAAAARRLHRLGRPTAWGWSVDLERRGASVPGRGRAGAREPTGGCPWLTARPR